MDSFEWNKIFGAILFALLVTFGLSIVSETIFETETPETPGYVIAVAEPTEGGEEAPGRAIDRGAPGERRRSRRGDRCPAVRRLPYPERGRAEQGRPEPLRRRQPADRRA